MRTFNRLAGWVVVIATSQFLAACHEKEAADPKDILREDLADEDNQVGGNPAPVRRQPAAPKRAASRPALASRAECERAARHTFELGYALGVAEVSAEKQRSEVKTRRPEGLESEEARQRIDQITEECLQQRTTRREAQCIAQVKSEAEIDRCSP
jgi:hypothetical protein